MIRINDPVTGWRDATSIAEYPLTCAISDMPAHNAITAIVERNRQC